MAQVSVSVLNSLIFSSQPLPFYYYDSTEPIDVYSDLTLFYFKKNEKNLHLTAEKSNRLWKKLRSDAEKYLSCCSSVSVKY